MRTPQPRKRFFISSLQHRLLLGTFLYMFSLALVFMAANLIPLVSTLDDGSLPAAVRDAAARHLLSMQTAVWVAGPLVLILCILHATLVSHRIAGPLYRFKEAFRQLGEGDLRIRVRIRERDYLAHEADAINAMIESLAGRVDRIHESNREAREALGQLVSAVGERDLHEVEILTGRLSVQLERLGESVRGMGREVELDDTLRTPDPDRTQTQAPAAVQ